MPASSTIFQTLVVCIATLTSAQSRIPTPQSTNRDVCSIPKFLWDVNGAQVCCPGVVDLPLGDRSKAYCCVGASLPNNAVITTTQTSCATMVSLNPMTDYSSKVLEAATKYGVTYTTNVGAGNHTVISTVTAGATETETASGSSEPSTGGAAARITAGAVILVAGGLLFGV